MSPAMTGIGVRGAVGPGRVAGVLSTDGPRGTGAAATTALAATVAPVDAGIALATAVAAVLAVGRLGPALPPAAAVALVVAQYVAIAAVAVGALTAGTPVSHRRSTGVLLGHTRPLLASLRPRRSDLAPAVRGWLGALGATALLTSVLTRLDVPVASNNAAAGGSFVAPGDPFAAMAAVLVLVVLFVVVVPVVEELLFRGVLVPALGARMGAVPALVLQAVVFAAFHADVRYGSGNVGLVLALVPSGLAFGVLARRRGLGAAVLAHALHNALALAVVLS